jgi:streptogramin lyase
MKLKVELLLTTILCLTLFTVLAPKPSQGYVVNEYVLPHAEYGMDPRPLNIIVGGRSGTDWGVYVYFTMPGAGRIGRMSARPSTTITIGTWAMPSDTLGISEPWDIDNITKTDGTEEYIYYTDYHLSRIGKVKPGDDSASVEYWGIPTSGAGPRGISVRDEKEIWFTEYLSDKIGKLNPSATDKEFIEYQLPVGSKPNDILVTILDGKTVVWFTEYSRDRIGMLREYGVGSDVSRAVVKEYPLPAGSRPYSLTMDPDGVIWFTCSGNNMIGELNPWTGEVILHSGIPTANSQPTGIAIDNQTREVWFTEFTGHKVAKYIPGDNLFIEYPTLTVGSAPSGIAVQRPTFNNLPLQVYFTEWSGNRIGVLEEGEPAATYGGTTTTTVTRILSALTGRFSAITADTTTTATSTKTMLHGAEDPNLGPIKLIGTSTTNATFTATTFRLSTSTGGMSTSYIVYAEHTTTTSTSTSTSYIATVSETSTYRSTSVSTSYIATTSITYTSTSYPTVYTATQSLTSTTRISVPDTLTTTLISTKYKKTTSATTSVTETLTAVEQRTATQTITATATIPVGTTTATSTQITTFTTLNLTFLPSCLIASAAYGSELDPAVQYLRGFRDNTVKATYAGSRFMDVFNAWYYSFSPTVARYVAESPAAKAAVKAYLTPLFPILQASAATYHMFQFNPELAVTLAGILASTLIGLVYDTPLAMLAQYAAWRKWRFKLKPKHLTPLMYAWAAALTGIAIAEVVQSSLLMEASTAVLVLASMAGSALLTSALIMGRVLGGRGLRRRLF